MSAAFSSFHHNRLRSEFIAQPTPSSHAPERRRRAQLANVGAAASHTPDSAKHLPPVHLFFFGRCPEPAAFCWLTRCPLLLASGPQGWAQHRCVSCGPRRDCAFVRRRKKAGKRRGENAAASPRRCFTDRPDFGPDARSPPDPRWRLDHDKENGDDHEDDGKGLRTELPDQADPLPLVSCPPFAPSS